MKTWSGKKSVQLLAKQFDFGQTMNFRVHFQKHFGFTPKFFVFFWFPKFWTLCPVAESTPRQSKYRPAERIDIFAEESDDPFEAFGAKTRPSPQVEDSSPTESKSSGRKLTTNPLTGRPTTQPTSRRSRFTDKPPLPTTPPKDGKNKSPKGIPSPVPAPIPKVESPSVRVGKYSNFLNDRIFWFYKKL